MEGEKWWKAAFGRERVKCGGNLELQPCPTSILPRSRKSVKYHFALTGTNLSISSANIISCSRQVLLINQNWRLVNLEAYDQSDDPTWTTLVLDWACATVMLLSHFHLRSYKVKLASSSSNWFPIEIYWDERLYYLRSCFYLLDILLRLERVRKFMIGS